MNKFISSRSAKIAAGLVGVVAGFAMIATSVSAATFTTNLKLGSTGADVKNLQILLNESPDTKVDGIGAGSAGKETSYFGPATKSAVIRFQNKYASDILTPNGLTVGTGFVGLSTRAKLNTMGGSVAVTGMVPGCSSLVGFSPTTGQSCATGAVTTSIPAGCTSTVGFSSTTGASCAVTVVTPTGAGLSVSAGTQPSNGLAIAGASRTAFTKVTLTAGSSDVVVNGITVERSGPAVDAAFSGVVLLEQDGTQIDIAKTFGSTHQAIIGGTFTVKAGTSKTLTIAGNMAAAASRAGQVASITVVAVNTSATVTGTLPITGAMHTINESLTIGTAIGETSSYNPSAQSKDIGTTGYKFSAVRLTAGSAEDVRVKSVRFYQAGSAGATDLSNVKIYVDGTAYDTTVSGNYYTSNFGSGIVIAKGLSKDIWIAGDITGSGSSSRTVDFDIQKNTDVYVTGETYGQGIIAGGTITTATPSFNGVITTIAAGTVTSIQKSNTVAAQNIGINVSSQPLGAYEVDMKGEAVSVQSHVFNIASTTGSGTGLLTSVSLYNANGAVVAGPVDAVYVSELVQSVTFTDTITYPVGKSTYVLKGKVPSTIGNGGTYIVTTTPSTQFTSVTGQTTGTTVTMPATLVTMNTMTVKSAALAISVSTQPSARSVVAGAQAFEFARYNLDASQSGEDVKLATFIASTTLATVTASQLSSCGLYDGATNVTDGTAITLAAGDNTFTFNAGGIVVTKGTMKVLSLKCNTSAGATSGSINWGLTNNASTYAGATGVTSGATVVETMTASFGQTMSATTGGSYTVDVDSSVLYGLAQAGTTGTTLAKFRFTAGGTESIDLKQIAFELGNTASNSPADLVNTKVTLWNGVTQIGTAQFGTTNPDNATSAILSPAPLIAFGESVVITVKGDLSAHNVNEGTPGAFLAITYDGNNNGANGNFATGVDSQSTITPTTADITTPGVRIFRTVPSFAVTSNGGTGTLIAGADLYKFTVTNPNSRDVVFEKFTFSIATSSSAVTGFTLYGDGVAFNTTPFTTAGVEGAPMEILASGTSNAQIVAANSTKTFILKAATVPNTSTTVIDSVTLALLADTSYPSLAGLVGTVATVELGSADTDNIIWSPFSTTTPVATAATQLNLDWTNGYGLPGFPSNTAFPVQTWTSSN